MSGSSNLFWISSKGIVFRTPQFSGSAPVDVGCERHDSKRPGAPIKTANIRTRRRRESREKGRHILRSFIYMDRDPPSRRSEVPSGGKSAPFWCECIRRREPLSITSNREIAVAVRDAFDLACFLPSSTHIDSRSGFDLSSPAMGMSENSSHECSSSRRSKKGILGDK